MNPLYDPQPRKVNNRAKFDACMPSSFKRVKTHTHTHTLKQLSFILWMSKVKQLKLNHFLKTKFKGSLNCKIADGLCQPTAGMYLRLQKRMAIKLRKCCSGLFHSYIICKCRGGRRYDSFNIFAA